MKKHLVTAILASTLTAVLLLLTGWSRNDAPVPPGTMQDAPGTWQLFVTVDPKAGYNYIYMCDTRSGRLYKVNDKDAFKQNRLGEWTPAGK